MIGSFIIIFYGLQHVLSSKLVFTNNQIDVVKLLVFLFACVAIICYIGSIILHPLMQEKMKLQKKMLEAMMLEVIENNKK